MLRDDSGVGNQGEFGVLSGVDLDRHVILPQLRVWHFADPCAVLFSIAIDDECFHDVFATGTTSSRRSLRIPASTRPAGANLRSNRRRFASPPAVYRSFGRAALAALSTTSATTPGCSAVAITSLILLFTAARTSRYSSSFASGSRKVASNGVFVYAGSITETRTPRVRSSWSSDSEYPSIACLVAA